MKDRSPIGIKETRLTPAPYRCLTIYLSDDEDFAAYEFHIIRTA